VKNHPNQKNTTPKSLRERQQVFNSKSSALDRDNISAPDYEYELGFQDIAEREKDEEVKANLIVNSCRQQERKNYLPTKYFD
jgi:hypothetical protein